MRPVRTWALSLPPPRRRFLPRKEPFPIKRGQARWPCQKIKDMQNKSPRGSRVPAASRHPKTPALRAQHQTEFCYRTKAPDAPLDTTSLKTGSGRPGCNFSQYISHLPPAYSFVPIVSLACPTRWRGPAERATDAKAVRFPPPTVPAVRDTRGFETTSTKG